MAKTITVKAGANGPVFLPTPIQGKRTIGDEPVEVDSTRFIRRRIEVGDLVVVESGGVEEVDDEELTTPGGAVAGAEVFTGESSGVDARSIHDMGTAKPVTPRRRSTTAPDKE